MIAAADKPWLSSAELHDLNAPFTLRGQQLRVAMRDWFTSPYRVLQDKRQLILWREPVLKQRWETPTKAFELRQGGWLPNGACAEGLSLAAQNLAVRDDARKHNNMAAADLIRIVVEAGRVEVRDTPQGTLWFFYAG